MSIHRRRIDRDTAELLLRGGLAGSSAGLDPLAALLASAAAPARADELAGEQAAMVAFRIAHRAPLTQPRRRSMISTTVAKILTAKAAAVAAATVLSGVAVAAGTGHLPTQHQDGATARDTHASQAAEPAESTHPTGKPSSAGSSGDHSATPSPSMVGLCRAFTAGAGSNPGKALENPAFTALITAAGGKDKVTTFCTAVLADAAHQAESSTTHSSGAPTTHPTGEPTTHPTGEPTTHPTGAPTGP
jgi:hypothetical protein